MSVLVVGLSHRTAPVSLLEQATLPKDQVPALLADMVASEHAVEAVVLSTCNRIEIYAEVDKFHGGVAEASELLAKHTGVPLDTLTPHLYVHYEDRAVAHLFSVVCGLDSMVVGESQILGQVKVALRVSQDAGSAGRVLNELAQQALRVGKRVRTDTRLDEAGRSLMTAGLDEASHVLGPIAGRRVLVVGAGSMSALAATLASARGAAEVVIANRTLAHATRVADAVGGSAVPLERVAEEMRAADLVVSCTGAVGHVIGTESVVGAVGDHRERPLVLLDLALPRDVEPEAHQVEGAHVVDLERLAVVLADQQHAADIEATRLIVAEEVLGFVGWQRAVAVAPTVVALRGMADAVVHAELSRLAGRLPDLDPRARAEIELAVRRVVDKVLHAPTVRVKELAEEPGGQSYADALGKLFDLDQSSVDALTRARIEEGSTP